MNRRPAFLVLVGLAAGLLMGAFHLGVLGFHPDALATSSARRARAVTRAPAVLGALTGRTPPRAVRVTVEPLRYDAEVWHVEVGGGPPLSLLALHGGETVALGPVLEARGGGYRLLGSREPGEPAAAPRTPDPSKVRLDPRDLAPGSGSGPWLAVYTASWGCCSRRGPTRTTSSASSGSWRTTPAIPP